MIRAALFILDPKSDDEIFLANIGTEASIGRSETADVFLDDIRCDGIHALLTQEASNIPFNLIDLGSFSGTYLDGRRIQEAKVQIGDRFTIGTKVLALRNPVADRMVETLAGQKRKGSWEAATTGKVLLTEKDLLEVSLYWGDRLLEVRTFESGSEVSLGSQKAATFGVTLMSPELQKHPFTLAKYEGGQLHLHIPTEGTGIAWIGNENIAIDTLRHCDRSTDEFRDVRLTLRIGDKADIAFGELALSFRFVRAPENLPTLVMPKFDRNWKNIGALLIGLYTLILSFILFSSREKPQEKTLEDLPKHLKRSVFDAGIARALQRRQSAIGQLSRDQQGGRARGEEGKLTAARSQEKQLAKPKSAPSKAKDSVLSVKSSKKSAERVDLDAAFSGSSAPAVAISDSLPGTPKTGNAAAALSDPGSFARGKKGEGAGGGGQSVGIGQLAGNSTGGGTGAGDYGLLPSRGHDISLSESEQVVILGGLDQDVIAAIIRRYLSQIQNCYEQQLVKKPQLKGKVTVAFTIAGDGSVRAAQVLETTLKNDPTEKCIIGRIKNWKFPKPKGGGTVGVKYPFLLMSNSGGGTASLRE